MLKTASNTTLCLRPVPQTIVSCRDKDGKNNALVVGFTANVSLDPAMVMVGIVPTRYSHHMIKEGGCFVVNLPAKSFKREYDYLGSHSGRDFDKVKETGLTPVTLNGGVAFEEAKMVLVCEKTYGQLMDLNDMADDSLQGKFYSSDAMHKLYIGRILAAYVKE